jgi:hypothetical protein
MSILPLVIIVGTVIVLGFIGKTVFTIAVDYGKRKGKGKS